jgi:hypothetical protein
MSWGRSRRRRSLEIASLIESLQALEDTDDFSDPIVHTDGLVPEIVASGRSPGLIHWFIAGFACAFVGGGVALVALLLVHPAQAKSGSSASTSAEPIVQSLIPETRQLWWKLPISVDRMDQSLLARINDGAVVRGIE